MEDPEPRAEAAGQHAHPDDQRAMTSMRVFRDYIKRTRAKDGREIIDASGVISRECYDLWVKTRKQLPPNPEKAFQRSLSAHVTGVDGRVPFTPSEEVAVLKVLRRKERWPCFEDSATRFGLMGFRAKGYHEKSSESSGDRKRFKYETSESEDDHETPTAPMEFKSAGIVRPFITGMPDHPVGYPIMMVPSMTPAISLDDFSFKPQLPVEPPQRNAQGEFSFLEMARDLLTRFYVSGIDTWSTVMSLARMVLLAQGWGAPPSTEVAEKVLNENLARHPNAIILAMDPASKLIRNRIVALSPVAQDLLGPVGRHQKGLERRIIPLSDAWPCLSAAFAAFKDPGSEHTVSLHVMGLDNILRPTNCTFRVYSDERLLVVRAMLV